MGARGPERVTASAPASCLVCEGLGAIWTGATDLDACPRCTALAEAAWLSRSPAVIPRRPALRVVERVA